MLRRSRGCFVRPEVRLPQNVGTILERGFHQSECFLEVADHALDKRVRHAYVIAHIQLGLILLPVGGVLIVIALIGGAAGAAR